ncbi:MAG: glycosyltransferase [Rhodocyclales bacterium]|nr:glycosyltransferase [Rhodocyclales bacterium]
MKVLHVIPSLSLAHGGPSRAIGLIERALRAQGVEVETATTDDDGTDKRKVRPGGTPIEEDGAVFRYFPKRSEFYKVAPAFSRWIGRHVRDYDVVHIHALFSFTSVVAARAARRAGVPYVLRPLGTLSRYGVTRRRPWLKRLSLKLVEGPLLRHAAAVHFTAEAERAEAEELGIPMRSVVIPLAVAAGPVAEPGLFVARFPQLQGKRILLFLSRLDPKKNVEGLLRAFRLIEDSLPGTRLVIAGDGEAGYVAGLKRLANELGLADRVVWTGFIDGELKVSAYATAQVFVLPSFSENFGIAAAEALMAGLPCVLGEGVAIAEEVAAAGAGLAVPPAPEAIAAALRMVLADDADRTEMGRRAAALARERYSVDAMGLRLVALYEGVVHGMRYGAS